MKWNAPILVSVLFLIACSEISYKEPQPFGINPLSQTPEKLQGKYLVSDENENTDTLVIDKTGYYIGHDEMAFLSDSLVLKYYKGYYFVNFRENFAWYLRILKLQKNGDLLYLEMDAIPNTEEDKVKFIERLSVVIPVRETTMDDKTMHVIDPSKKKLIELIKKGYFKEQTFRRIR